MEQNLDDFDESIFMDEAAFRKRFRRIERPGWLDSIVKKASQEWKDRELNRKLPDGPDARVENLDDLG